MKDILSLIKNSGLRYDSDGDAKNFSGYKGGGKLKYIVYPETLEDLEKISGIVRRSGVPFYVLGGGFNTLIKDGGYFGLTISTKRLKGISAKGNTLICGGGEFLPKAAAFAAKSGLGGLEALGGIPSTIGGAVYMNAGAFGSQTADTLLWADCFDINEGVSIRLSKEEIPFAYRNSGGVFDGKIIYSAAFGLSESAGAAQKTEAYIKERLDNQPREPSLGCAFKNPDLYPAGYLIDSVGLKGFRHGGAAISEKHANFIVNTGEGTASDYFWLMDLAKAMVYGEYMIELQPEIKIIGQ
ncbi:MAG TPA: UDP-N-acetylmuramate dehydrogenase [Clostridia bacterium]|nr:UDP-N-acetylmuramate dehydrogenase [Clostridia bacterium]